MSMSHKSIQCGSTITKEDKNSHVSLTPSTLDSCSYRFKMYLKAENMPFHMVKTVFKYSFLKQRYGVLKMSTSHVAETLKF